MAPWFNLAKEALPKLILNARLIMMGHNLVALGCLDSISIQPLQVFCPIVAGGRTMTLPHNHASGRAQRPRMAMFACRGKSLLRGGNF